MADGCSGKPTPTAGSHGPAPTSSAAGKPSDYAKLLIQATDIVAPEPFTAGPQTNDPNGQPGVATTFSTQDGLHVIHDTIQVLSDGAAATNALNAAKGAQANTLKHPATQPAKIGGGGATITGNALDHSKGVTILMFTEGKAFVTLQFDGPVDSLAPPDFVNDVGQKQDAAVKKGLGG
nr:hypothetical protein [Mycobacterium sp. 1164966.3]